MNLQPTLEIIDAMIEHTQELVKELQRERQQIAQSKDIEQVSSVVNTVVNYISNLRLDLLVARPVRALIWDNYDKMEKKCSG